MPTTNASRSARDLHHVCNNDRITLEELADLCDDPAREESDAIKIRVILTYDTDHGFFLSAQDGDRILYVKDDDGRPVKFRTIEQAIEVLQDSAYSDSEVHLDIAGTCGAHVQFS
jgi:hypothetical protein